MTHEIGDPTLIAGRDGTGRDGTGRDGTGASGWDTGKSKLQASPTSKVLGRKQAGRCSGPDRIFHGTGLEGRPQPVLSGSAEIAEVIRSGRVRESSGTGQRPDRAWPVGPWVRTLCFSREMTRQVVDSPLTLERIAVDLIADPLLRPSARVAAAFRFGGSRCARCGGLSTSLGSAQAADFPFSGTTMSLIFLRSATVKLAT